MNMEVSTFIGGFLIGCGTFALIVAALLVKWSGRIAHDAAKLSKAQQVLLNYFMTSAAQTIDNVGEALDTLTTVVDEIEYWSTGEGGEE